MLPTPQGTHETKVRERLGNRPGCPAGLWPRLAAQQQGPAGQGRWLGTDSVSWRRDTPRPLCRKHHRAFWLLLPLRHTRTGAACGSQPFQTRPPASAPTRRTSSAPARPPRSEGVSPDSAGSLQVPGTGRAPLSRGAHGPHPASPWPRPPTCAHQECAPCVSRRRQGQVSQRAGPEPSRGTGPSRGREAQS